MNCQEVKENLSSYLETDLPDDEKSAILQHLASCTTCREELETLLKVIGAVKNLRKVDVPTGFSDRIMARVKEEEKKKIQLEKRFPFFGFSGLAYGLVVLLFGGILYTIFRPEKNSPVQLSQMAPAVVQEATKPPMTLKKEEMLRSAPETDRVSPAAEPRGSVKAPTTSALISPDTAPAVEPAKSVPIQSLNRLSSNTKNKDATLSIPGDKKSDAPNLPAPSSPDFSARSGPVTEGTIESSKMTGLEIMKKRSEAYMASDQMSTVTLHLFTREGDVKQIKTKRYWKNFAGKDGIATKTLFFTEFPPDAKGTGFLIWNYSDAGKRDDLWLYLPSLRQTRHVSSRGQDDAFMGSDLTFGDMAQRKMDKDDHKLLKEEPCGDETCYVVESVSKDKEGVYSKKIFWITKKDFIAMKIEYFDRRGELLKSQKINWQEVSGYKAWKSSEVVNVQTQHKTIFEISDLQINSGLKDDLFKERTLKTGIQ